MTPYDMAFCFRYTKEPISELDMMETECKQTLAVSDIR